MATGIGNGLVEAGLERVAVVEPGQRVLMGEALVGGMLFATLLGIFVYPALYYFVGRIGNFERRRERKKQEEKL